MEGRSLHRVQELGEICTWLRGGRERGGGLNPLHRRAMPRYRYFSFVRCGERGSHGDRGGGCCDSGRGSEVRLRGGLWPYRSYLVTRNCKRSLIERFDRLRD